MGKIKNMVLEHHQQTEYERRELMALGIERLRDALVEKNTKPETLRAIFKNEQYRKPAPGTQRMINKVSKGLLWKQGKLMKSVYAWCKKEMGYKEGNGIPEQITHGICDDCAEKVKRGE